MNMAFPNVKSKFLLINTEQIIFFVEELSSLKATENMGNLMYDHHNRIKYSRLAPPMKEKDLGNDQWQERKNKTSKRIIRKKKSRINSANHCSTFKEKETS
jgi:hypothetical protein